MSNIQDIITDEFQYAIDEFECINKSILDQMAKLNEYACKLNKSITTASTQCGCIQIYASKHSYDNLNDLSSQNKAPKDCYGILCNECTEHVEKYMGSLLYYLASLCNTLDLNLYDVFLKELEKIYLLRQYNLK